MVSIHAPRVGCDISCKIKISRLTQSFNPRTPGGVRHAYAIEKLLTLMFQSTHPGWGATFALRIISYFKFVSIHAPRVGCDNKLRLSSVGISSFNPRTPGGVRPSKTQAETMLLPVSIHAPRVGCDINGAISFIVLLVSIHAPRVGCDSIKRKGLKVRVICGTFCERIGVDFL